MLSKLLSEDLESYYWIGFIIADGWVSSRINVNGSRINHVGISLQKIDQKHLEKFLNWVEIPHSRIRSRIRHTNYKENSKEVSVCITDHISVPLLKEKFDISNNKTKVPPKMKLYNLSSDQMISLIIGFIDGDGSISMRATHKPHISIQSTRMWSENLQFINECIHNSFDEKITNKVLINNRNHASLSICKRMVVAKLKQFVIINGLPVLDRKWDLIEIDSLTEKIEKDYKVRYQLIAPSGETFNDVRSLRKFCIEHNLDLSKFYRALEMGTNACDGWKIKITTESERLPRTSTNRVLTKDGVEYKTSNLKNFCRINNIQYYKMLKACNNGVEYDGWMCTNEKD